MGTKIKPSFKSGFETVSEGWHLFRVKEPNIEVIADDEQKEKDGIKNDKNYTVRSVVEGGEEDGVGIMEFFANHSKKEFGLSRLAGLMIKAAPDKFPPVDEIDVDTMRTDKFETKFKMALPERLFGGKVKHIPGKKKEKKEGQEETEPNIFANIIEYATVKEYNEIITKKDEKAGKSMGTKKEPAEKAQGKEESKKADDPWA